MIKVKDGYAKLIGTEYKGNGSRLLVTNGADVGYSSESIANNIVQRNANQHVFATYYQSNISDEAISSIGSIYVRNTSDNYIRRVSKAQFYTVLGEKFVTLDTAQTISGSKTFSQQIKSTVDTTKPPFIINSNKCVQNLNADLLDDWQLVDIVKSGSITCGVQGLSSYWGKMWDTTVTSNYNDVDITLYVHSVYMQQWGIIGIRARLNKSEDARSMNVSLSGIVGNLPQDRFRLYYNVSSGLCQLWCNVNVQYGVYNYIVLSKTNRNTVELANNGNFYSSNFTTAQSLPSDEYADLEYIGIRNNSATSTKLQTARTINGTAFDGTQNITTAIWGSTRTISLTGAVTGSVSTNGGANITISTSYGDMSSLNSRFVNVTGDTMTGPLKFNGATGIGFNSANIEGADNIGTTVKIHPGQDGASQDKANLRIGSWYGVGWYPTVENQTVAKGKHAMWLNVRNGNLNIVGTFEAGGNVVTRSRAIAQRGGRTDKVALFQSNAENQGGIVLTDKTNTEHILYLTTSNLTWKGRKVWDSGNDGAGSGLDADLLDGLDGSNFYNEFAGNQWYHLYIDNSDTTGSTWYKVCSVKFTGEEVPAWVARKINGYLYDSKSNWQSNSTEIIPFQIVINLSKDTATIYSTVMWNSSKLRVLKIGTRNYEIQFSTGSNYLDSNIYYTLEGNNTHVTCYTKLEQATSGSTYITSCSQLNSYGNNSYHSTSSDTATTANKLGSSTIGSATVPIYLNAGSPKACSSTSAATANTIAVRDGSGDLLCRLVRANYADQNTMSGGIVFRINNSGDNYLRCCNNPSAVRSWLGIGSSGDYVTALGTIGNNLTWTKNGTTNNIIIPYATNSGKVANSLVLKFNSGTVEGTNLYTFNGSSGKTISIRPGLNVQFATTSGTVVINSTNTTYRQATSSTLGLVKIGYGEDGKNYPVELNGSGQMYVNVPWTDNNTTYTAGTNLTLNGNEFSVKVGSTNAGNRVVGTAEDGTIYESEALTSELQYLLSDWSGTTGIMTLLGKKQNTITGGATTITSSNLTASRVLVSNSSGKVAVSRITSAELGYLDGVTSGIQTQINSIKYNWLWYQGKSSGSVTDNPGSTYGAIINGNCPKYSVLKGVYATYNDTNMSAEDLIADNANTIITIKSSGGNYFNQLMIAQRGRLFTRSFANQIVTETKEWNVVPLCSAPQIWNAYQDFRGGAGNSGSDMRFKKEVQNVGNILSKINDLNVIKYIWEHPDESQVKYTFGIDANKLLELGGIFATMVHSRNDKHDTKWVEYDRFGVLAIKAIQELCQTIQQMKNRIEILENKICLNSI